MKYCRGILEAADNATLITVISVSGGKGIEARNVAVACAKSEPSVAKRTFIILSDISL